MAALAHMGVALASKPAAPKIPLAALVVSAYIIDIIWGAFFFAGVERLAEPGEAATNGWSHSLVMAVVYSVAAGLLAWRVAGSTRTGWIIGLLVFSHWAVDFISHPMTAVFPDATGVPLLPVAPPVVGLGVWRTQLGVTIGEYGTLAVGMVVYAWTFVQRRRHNVAAAAQVKALALIGEEHDAVSS